MTTTLIIVAALVIYVIVYLLYGKRIATNVAKLDPKAQTPAQRLYDGVDFVPTKWPVVFGHHFASIAGAGPIVGPIIGVTWGWVPAILWIWFGNAFIGAVHDFMAIVASIRYDGKSIQWVAGEVMKPRVSTIMGIFVWIAMVLIIAAFTNVVAGLFINIPSVATASIGFIIIAVIIGYLLYWKKQNLVAMTILGLVLLVGALFLSQVYPLVMDRPFWLIALLVYIIIAAALPVTILLQPRDYLNAYILLAFLAVGGVAFLILNAPLNWPAFTLFSAHAIGAPAQASPFWPTVPLVIACGSLSGFHAIVGSGTTSKMIDNEMSALRIGYGGMLLEGFLATIVVVSLGAFGLQVAGATAGEVGVAGWVPLAIAHFSEAYAMGANQAFGMAMDFGMTFASLTVCAFALTSLDTTARLGRFAWQDVLGRIVSPAGQASGGYKFITHRWIASLIAAGIGVYMATTDAFTALWVGFGAANQMLAAIALMTACVFSTNVLRGGKFCWVTMIPAFFLWVTVFAAMIWYVITFISIVNPITIGFVVVMIVLSLILLLEVISALRAGPKK